MSDCSDGVPTPWTGRRTSWRPCCGACRSEKIEWVPGYVCADCKAPWDGSELTEAEAQATPPPPWLPKSYPG
jgi:hypothetical protein